MMNLLEKLSTEDCIRREDETGLKHEYHDGWVVAMSGVTEEHNLVASAVRNYLLDGLRVKGCRIHSSAIRVFVPECNKFVYPDATVVCGKSQHHKLPRGTYALTNPSAIVEVAFEGTVEYDQEKKYACYQTLASFHEYLLVAQDQVRVEIRKKLANGQWSTEVFDQPNQTMEVLGCSVSLRDIYEDIAL